MSILDQIHPEQLEKMKIFYNYHIFQAHIWEAIYNRNYEDLEALIKFKHNHISYWRIDSGLIKNIIINKDYRSLRIIIKGEIASYKRYLPSDEIYTYGDNYFIMIESIVTLDDETFNILFEEIMKSNISVDLFNIYGHIKKKDSLIEIVRRKYYEKHRSAKATEQTKKMVKTFTAAVHKQVLQANEECFESMSSAVSKCTVKVKSTKGNLLLTNPNKLEKMVECLNELKKQQQYIVNNRCLLETDGLTAQHLEDLSYYLTKKEFDEFIASQEIDIAKFDVNLKRYQLETQKPLLTSTNQIHTIEDILLQRTYSDLSNMDKITQIYNSLLGSENLVVRETMTMVLLNIINGDDIKILFSHNSVYLSHYNYYTNIINVGIKPTGNCLSVSSATIHEMGHYMFYKLYDTLATPLKFDSLINFLPNLKDTHKFMEVVGGKNIYSGIREALKITEGSKLTTEHLFKYFNEADKFLSYIQDYETGVRGLLSYAMKLLQIDNTDSELNRYFNSTELIEYVKYKVPVLDLFLVASMSQVNQHKISYTYSYSVAKNMFEIYIQGVGFDVCPSNVTNLYSMPLNIAVEAIKEYSYKSIAVTYQLTHNDICFLKRIADFTNRHLSAFDEELLFYDNNLGPYQEMIIRYAELIILGSKPKELKEAFNGSLVFWKQHVLPDIQAHIVSYEDECKKLYLNNTHNQDCNDTENIDCNIQGDTTSLVAECCDIFIAWEQNYSS